MTDRTPMISLVWIGHVDHGKSTTLGHLLYLIGAVDKRTVDKYREEAKKFQRDSWVWAYILDSLPEEMEKGITSDIAFFPFKTEKRRFMLIDAPGHRDFVKNMIRGTSQADACVLVVSVVPNDLKAGLKKGSSNDPGGQTREHAVLASVLGIERVIIAINKMDLVNYSKEAYDNAVLEIKKLLNEIQSPWTKKIASIPFVPISGYQGDNLVSPSEKTSWYSGPTLIEALNQLDPIKFDDTKELRFIGYDSDEKPGLGTFLIGKTIGGRININEKIKLLPSNEEATIKEMWVDDKQVTTLDIGEHAEILLKGINKDKIESGAVIIPVTSDYSLPDELISRLLILDGVFVPGGSFVTHCGASYAASKLLEITKILSISSKHKHLQREMNGKITMAFSGEIIEARIKLDSPLVVEKFTDFQELGRIILRRSGTTVGVGIVKDIH